MSVIKTKLSELLRANNTMDEFFISEEICRNYENLEAENASLRERTRWIPVSERLPEDGVSVLAVISSVFEPHQIVLLARHYSEVPEWVTDDAFYYYDKEYERITHWMPLSAAPKEDE